MTSGRKGTDVNKQSLGKLEKVELRDALLHKLPTGEIMVERIKILFGGHINV